jgi:hypothetical protein
MGTLLCCTSIICNQYLFPLIKGDFTVIQLQNGTLTLGDYHSPGGHSKPIPDTTNNLALIESETDGTSYVSVKFTRLLDTGDIQDRVLQRGMNF